MFVSEIDAFLLQLKNGFMHHPFEMINCEAFHGHECMKLTNKEMLGTWDKGSTSFMFRIKISFVCNIQCSNELQQCCLLIQSSNTRLQSISHDTDITFSRFQAHAGIVKFVKAFINIMRIYWNYPCLKVRTNENIH